jgi:hypothetical protein
MLDLLRAFSACYLRGQRLDVVRYTVSLHLAATGLVAAFVDVAATPISVAGAAWAIVYVAGVKPWTKSEARRAAVAQEMFDVELFGLPWNDTAVGRRLSPTGSANWSDGSRQRGGGGSGCSTGTSTPPASRSPTTC